MADAPEDCDGKSTLEYEELRRKERYGRLGAGVILARDVNSIA